MLYNRQARKLHGFIVNERLNDDLLHLCKLLCFYGCMFQCVWLYWLKLVSNVTELVSLAVSGHSLVSSLVIGRVQFPAVIAPQTVELIDNKSPEQSNSRYQLPVIRCLQSFCSYLPVPDTCYQFKIVSI